jgi:hypothetical protein
MNSERRIQASRANGARSRGPVTAQGKLNSSRNSTRHGILAQTIVLESESRSRFEDLLIAYTIEFQPRTPAETNLVESMAIARWRQLRVLHIQRAGFDLEMARQETPEDSAPARAATVFRNLSDNSRSLDLLLRYETAFDRQFTRALSALLKLQSRPNRGDGATLPPDTIPAATFDSTKPQHPVLPNEPVNPLKTNPGPSDANSHQGGAGLEPAADFQSASPRQATPNSPATNSPNSALTYRRPRPRAACYLTNKVVPARPCFKHSFHETNLQNCTGNLCAVFRPGDVRSGNHQPASIARVRTAVS